MLLNDKNIIKKQVLEINYIGKTDALRLRQDIDVLCNQSLIPEIEILLDKWNTPDRTLRIDELKVEINDLHIDTLEKELVPKIIEELKKVWNEKFISSGPAVEEIQSGNSLLEQLDFFLLHGYLPWFVPTVSADEWFGSLQEFFNKINASQSPILKQTLSHASARQRLIQLPDDVFWQIIRGIFPWNTNLMNEIYSDIKLLLRKTGENIEHIYKSLLIEKIIIPSIQPDDFTFDLFFSLPDLNTLIEQFNVNEWKSESFRSIFPQIQQLGFKDWKKSKEYKKDTTPYKLLTKAAQIKDDSEIHEEIYINNAGLVIIAPYLNSFFSNIGFIENSELKQKDQAVLLLNYIITGSSEPVEFELVLPKILCGIPVEQIVNTTIELNEDYKIESVKLLNSIIKNWSALKNTSIDGLRESFVQRSGRLSFNINQWSLVVEQKSYDVLLEKLPWSILYIHLPWMKNILTVDWI